MSVEEYLRSVPMAELHVHFEYLAPYFERARAEGVHAAPHAGETVGPASIQRK